MVNGILKCNKIMVIGCPGGGKSTFARALGEIIKLPVYHLDMLNWNADKTTVDRETFLLRLGSVLEKDRWIIDGNYSFSMEMRLKECDAVFFLDYPAKVCLDGVRTRMGKPRPDMPWIEQEYDEEFIQFIKSFKTERCPQIYALLEKYSDKPKVVFKTRAEAEEFLEAVRDKTK